MTGIDRLDAAETRAWRALVRIATILPRHLNDELMDTRRVSLSEFGLLLHLSESDHGTLRMSDLAEATGISPSRVTRVIETMRGHGWVQKVPDASDGRATTVILTAAGSKQTDLAYDVQVEGARRTLFDHLTPDEVEELGRLLTDFVEILRAEDRFD
ncbi:MarR family winged helix-turn-helix transcriptional regulator [Leifsonia sp. NPDC056665]|uniref:MarR family winged helix-turn-helix transcriptional regulator n=1 Tax=Leifsonia sp. NPDC056665 TaxID=3345901 RepID=UPI0036AAA25D